MAIHRRSNITIAVCLLFIVAAIITVSYYMPSAYRKGGVPNRYHYYNLASIGLMALAFTLLLRELNWVQKIFFSGIASVFGFMLSFICTEAIIECMYGYDYEIYANHYIANLIFYSLAFLCAVLPLSAVRWMK